MQVRVSVQLRPMVYVAREDGQRHHTAVGFYDSIDPPVLEHDLSEGDVFVPFPAVLAVDAAGIVQLMEAYVRVEAI